ncbi:hypothetical protein MtrunA17_Chr5g0420001 [Medicago truncatula]|uniref:Uncharacterized protein n=1 Tax=Medicago truncatula TaxID=3880 RepID=A0A396HW66_MEDTR|nr:hypothetical protein MtrunA17_Chr5g0420001 [Medicago truncatula]
MSTKDNLVKNIPKRHLQGCSIVANIVADEDPIIRDIMRSKEVTTNVLVGDVINLEEELYSSTSVEAIQVQSTPVEGMTETQGVDQQSNKFPDMRIVGSWSDAVTDLDYNQDPPSWYGLGSSNVMVSKEVLNPNIAHDLEILRPYLKGNDACASVPQVYTDEEEREAAINYLKNRSVAEDEPFIEVSKSKKKKVQKHFQVHNTRSRGSPPN